MPFRSGGGTGGGGGGGTVTSISVAADNGTGGSITGAGTISILGGANVDTNVTGTTVTINRNYVTTLQTSTYTVLAADRVVFCDPTVASFVVTLPTVVDGAVFTIKALDTASPTNTVTVNPQGTEQIDGAIAGTGVVLTSANQSITVVGDTGGGYWII